MHKNLPYNRGRVNGSTSKMLQSEPILRKTIHTKTTRTMSTKDKFTTTINADFTVIYRLFTTAFIVSSKREPLSWTDKQQTLWKRQKCLGPKKPIACNTKCSLKTKLHITKSHFPLQRKRQNFKTSFLLQRKLQNIRLSLQKPLTSFMSSISPDETRKAFKKLPNLEKTEIQPVGKDLYFKKFHNSDGFDDKISNDHDDHQFSFVGGFHPELVRALWT